MKIKKDQNYFELIDTEGKAYILGFIMADGCINMGRIRIKLGLKDSEHLKKISFSLLGFDHTVITKPPKNPCMIKGRVIKDNGGISLTICSQKWVSDLIKHKCVSAKSLILEFPEIPSNLLNHFVRGYFDGDGCISSRKYKKVTRFTLTILSSLLFCQSLAKIGKLHGMNFKVGMKSSSKISKAEGGGNRRVEEFCDWMYKNATIYLGRKYDKYLELKKLIKDIDIRTNNRYKDSLF